MAVTVISRNQETDFGSDPMEAPSERRCGRDYARKTATWRLPRRGWALTDLVFPRETTPGRLGDRCRPERPPSPRDRRRYNAARFAKEEFLQGELWRVPTTRDF